MVVFLSKMFIGMKSAIQVYNTSSQFPLLVETESKCAEFPCCIVSSGDFVMHKPHQIAAVENTETKTQEKD